MNSNVGRLPKSLNVRLRQFQYANGKVNTLRETFVDIFVSLFLHLSSSPLFILSVSEFAPLLLLHRCSLTTHLTYYLHGNGPDIFLINCH